MATKIPKGRLPRSIALFGAKAPVDGKTTAARTWQCSERRHRSQDGGAPTGERRLGECKPIVEKSLRRVAARSPLETVSPRGPPRTS